MFILTMVFLTQNNAIEVLLVDSEAKVEELRDAAISGLVTMHPGITFDVQLSESITGYSRVTDSRNKLDCLVIKVTSLEANGKLRLITSD